ncbi:NAD(P)/FAD-dependent oxidoreductase [Altererythrobacter sp.]|uniref:NAD(P)/FAD-dependent oxidoreductase n=1 Tax=Altererythrobacter sp. TaxID=1872480 RepID=UPI003D02A534
MIENTKPLAKSYDAIVIGARCAGASTAMLLARHGARVLMVDRAPYGSDTLSTHALMRGAVMQLQNWGVLPQIIAAGTPPIRSTSFIYGERPPIDITIKPSLGIPALYAPRRMVLDSELATSACHAGVDCRFGMSLTGLLRGRGGVVSGASLRDRHGVIHDVEAEMVIGADGRDSLVAREAGAETLKRASNTSYCIYGYFKGLHNRGYRWHWGEHCGGGIIPTNDGNSNVFLSIRPGDRQRFRGVMREQGFRAALAQLMPQLAQELEGAQLTGRLVAFAGAPGHMRQACGYGWALVGDAGYFKDPLTAHGITDALRDAQLLADSWAKGRLDDYARTRDTISRDIFRITDEIAGLDYSLGHLAELHESLQLAIKANQNWMAEHLMTTAVAA